MNTNNITPHSDEPPDRLKHDNVEAESAESPDAAPDRTHVPDALEDENIRQEGTSSSRGKQIPADSKSPECHNDPAQDLEKGTAGRDAAGEEDGRGAGSNTTTLVPHNIEDTPVADDPRHWSAARKWSIVAIVSYGALTPTMGQSMFFPAIEDMKRDLGATEQDISLSVSLYILAQGLFPLLWSPASELIGRKPCFIAALTLYTIFTGFTALANNMATVIALRTLAASASSVALAVAAGTLSDLFVVEERGVVVGLYYAIPISGPALAPIIGGALTEASGWKAVFWFLAAAGASSALAYCCMKETFRTERSAAWQKARAEALKKMEHDGESEKQPETLPDAAVERADPSARPAATSESKASHDKDSHHQPHAVPEYRGPGLEYLQSHPEDTSGDASHHPRAHGKDASLGQQSTAADTSVQRPTGLGRVISHRSIHAAGRVRTRDGGEIKFKPSLSDVSPLRSAAYVLSKPHNLAALIYSGISFAAQYSLSFTATTTFVEAPYNYSPILIGCVLLALGVGGMVGSIIGGKISDLRLRKVMKATGSKAPSEVRLRTILIPMILTPPAYVAYGWLTEKHVNIAGPVTMLFVIGYAQIHSYSVDLSYLVDSNPGRSSGAVAVNSAFRGTLAFIASEVSSPILNAVGNGPLQTGWAVLMVFTVVLLIITSQRGEQWRSPEWRWPRVWRVSEWKRGREGGTYWIRQKEEEKREEKSQESTSTPA
ncbi:unnamed protein product [Sympodiomycopsis kandeliae]